MSVSHSVQKSTQNDQRTETETTRGKLRGKSSRYAQGNDFFNWTSRTQEVIARTDKWDCIKLKKLLHSKGNNQQGRESL
jgi:hypothetical protein